MGRPSVLKSWLAEEMSEGRVDIGSGSSNEFLQFVSRVRESFIKSGFKELVLPIVGGKSDLLKQRGFSFYSNDAYHLSGSMRYTSLSFDDLKQFVPDADEELYKRVLDVLEDYKLGRLSARDVPRALVARVGLLLDQAILVSDKAIPLRVKATQLVLRSFMASAWVSALGVLYSRYPSPQAYFTVGRIFDPTAGKVKGRFHASGVIIGNTSVDQMKRIVLDIVSGFGISPSISEEIIADTLFVPRSYHALSFKGVKFGYVAQLSFTSLGNYGIEDPVVIFDLDLLSMYRAMGKEPMGALYPWLLGEWYIPDEEIASHLKIARRPETTLGKEILVAIMKNTKLYSSQPAPCEFKVYEKEFEDKGLEVWVVGYDKALVGSGFNNEVIVYKGNIMALQPVGDSEQVMNGVRTGITLGEALANFVSRQIELDPTRPREFQIDKTSLENANIYIPKQIVDYVSHIGADINLEAPVSFRVEARVKKLWVYRKDQ